MSKASHEAQSITAGKNRVAQFVGYSTAFKTQLIYDKLQDPTQKD